MLCSENRGELHGSRRMTWYERVPKVELHVHLEGAIPHDALIALIQKYGWPRPFLTFLHWRGVSNTGISPVHRGMVVEEPVPA